MLELKTITAQKAINNWFKPDFFSSVIYEQEVIAIYGTQVYVESSLETWATVLRSLPPRGRKSAAVSSQAEDRSFPALELIDS